MSYDDYNSHWGSYWGRINRAKKYDQYRYHAIVQREPYRYDNPRYEVDSYMTSADQFYQDTLNELRDHAREYFPGKFVFTKDECAQLLGSAKAFKVKVGKKKAPTGNITLPVIARYLCATVEAPMLNKYEQYNIGYKSGQQYERRLQKKIAAVNDMDNVGKRVIILTDRDGSIQREELAAHEYQFIYDTLYYITIAREKMKRKQPAPKDEEV